MRLSIDLRKVGSGWTRSVFRDRTTSYRCIHVRYNEILCHLTEVLLIQTYRSEGINLIDYCCVFMFSCFKIPTNIFLCLYIYILYIYILCLNALKIIIRSFLIMCAGYIFTKQVLIWLMKNVIFLNSPEIHPKKKHKYVTCIAIDKIRKKLRKVS